MRYVDAYDRTELSFYEWKTGDCPKVLNKARHPVCDLFQFSPERGVSGARNEQEVIYNPRV